MSRFIESIQLRADGSMPLLAYHQARIDRTFAHFFPKKKPIILAEVIKNQTFSKYFSANPTLPLRKVRLLYNSEGLQFVETLKYNVRPVRSLRLVEIPPSFDYSFKYEDRADLNHYFEQRKEADDILMVQNGFLRDSFYANLIFWTSEGEGLTPEKPLLRGTRRAFLLDTKQIKTAQIHVADLKEFTHLSLINAMMDAKSVELPTHAILNL